MEKILINIGLVLLMIDQRNDPMHPTAFNIAHTNMDTLDEAFVTPFTVKEIGP